MWMRGDGDVFLKPGSHLVKMGATNGGFATFTQSSRGRRVWRRIGPRRPDDVAGANGPRPNALVTAARAKGGARIAKRARPPRWARRSLSGDERHELVVTQAAIECSRDHPLDTRGHREPAVDRAVRQAPRGTGARCDNELAARGDNLALVVEPVHRDGDRRR